MDSSIWAITSYFNPCGYKTRRANFELFRDHLAAQSVPLLTVEMALLGADFELPDSPNYCRVRGGGNLWQKERLLNIAIERLPPECTKVVWLDCDLIFEDLDWLSRTSAALDQFSVVQPFSQSIRLPQGVSSLGGEAHLPAEYQVEESFAAAFLRDPALAFHAPYAVHGHTGFAWAARREVVSMGLYDACLTGSGDHLMAHVFAGACLSPCIAAMIGQGHSYAEHFANWAQRMDRACQGRLGCVSGRLLHLWHGAPEFRRYRDHNTELRQIGFNPETDIRIGPEGLWEWSAAGEKVRAWSASMFESRREDG